MHLDIRSSLVFTHSVKVEHGAVIKISYYHFYRTHTNTKNLSKTTNIYYHTEKNDRRHNTDTMSGRERDRWERNLYLPTMVGTLQTLCKKEIKQKHRTTSQIRNNHQN